MANIAIDAKVKAQIESFVKRPDAPFSSSKAFIDSAARRMLRIFDWPPELYNKKQ